MHSPMHSPCWAVCVRSALRHSYQSYILTDMSNLVNNRCEDCDKEMEALEGAHVWCGSCGHLMTPLVSHNNMEEMSNG